MDDVWDASLDLAVSFVLAILACVGWFTRDMWLPERFRPHTVSVASGRWQPATDAGAERARAALVRLSQPKGPVFETLPAGDLASLAASEVTARVGGSADSVAAQSRRRSAVGARARRLREPPRQAWVRWRVCSATGRWSSSRARFHMLKPGLGEFEVQSAKVGQMTLPQGMIPRLLQEIDHGTRPAGLTK